MAIDTSPTARALLALQLIQSGQGITADRLADKLGVTERAARRYVGILREAGIPIESMRGPYGGYRVGRGVRLPPLMFTATEVLGLVMAVLDGHHDAADTADPVGSALGKLLRALPEPIARQAAAVRRTTAPAPDRAAARPDPMTATTLVQASMDHRVVRLGYRSEAGSEWVAEVVVDAPASTVIPCVPRVLGLVEPIDDDTCRLVGSTSNPWWYAEQLAALPAPFRIVGGPELQATARALGQRLLAAADPRWPESPVAGCPPGASGRYARSPRSYDRRQ
ncbi:helix-turn-helix transcriptional regulator [Jiangella asiatica]|uniref:HTH domain-containing protein n=1 Tax=Jiangella asiatica TaxID=2530372 RepID=A0A4V2Z313_9ACTN|nr:HTH domain-containing protein [Jiangella asiatica]TDE10168.1 HTH domain-containing protein [Jiangella asiatica]